MPMFWRVTATPSGWGVVSYGRKYGEEQRYRLFLINDNFPVQQPVVKDDMEKVLPHVAAP